MDGYEQCCVFSPPLSAMKLAVHDMVRLQGPPGVGCYGCQFAGSTAFGVAEPGDWDRHGAHAPLLNL